MSLKLGTIDISGIPTNLINTVNNKLDASTYTSNPRTNAVYITETYHNGDSWYRIWSDGFIEQGGHSTSKSATTTINLLRNFSDTNYNVSVTWDNSSTLPTYTPIVSVTDTSSFIVFHNASGALQCTQYWRACGY